MQIYSDKVINVSLLPKLSISSVLDILYIFNKEGFAEYVY
jgi:hypothetical protein